MKLGINRINIWMLLLSVIKNMICPFMKDISLKKRGWNKRHHQHVPVF